MGRLSAYALCGLAFSGKTTTARIIASELDAALLSLDAINDERGLKGGEGMTVSQWEETSAIAMERLRGALRSGRSAVIDDTFSHRFLRDRCGRVAEECGARFVILFIDTPIEEIAARRARNERDRMRHQVRDEIFERHRAEFQFPTDDEPVSRIGGERDLRRWIEREKAIVDSGR